MANGPGRFWDAAGSSYAGTSITFLTPRATRKGDSLIVVLILAIGQPLTLPTGWSILVRDQSLCVLRRIATEDEPAQHVFTTANALAPNPVGVLLVYRALNVEAGLVDEKVAAQASSTAYVAPSVTATSYSDVELAIFYALDLAATATFTSTLQQRGPTVHGTPGASGGTLAVFENIALASGATGTKNATCSTAVAGVVCAVLLKSMPTLPAPFVVPDVAGAIGLVSKGV